METKQLQGVKHSANTSRATLQVGVPTCAARDCRSVLLVLSWLEALAAAACAADSSSCRLLTAVAKDDFSACNTANGNGSFMSRCQSAALKGVR